MKIIRNNRIKKSELQQDETIFSIANGFLGTRGQFVEGYGEFGYPETYLNAFYNFYDYHYEENLSGFPQQGQKYVNLFDGTKIEFIIDNKPLNLTNGTLLELNRTYDIESGVTYRNATYLMNGFHFEVSEKKLVSHELKYVISLDVTVTSKDYQGPVLVKSYLTLPSRVSKTNDPRIHVSNESHLEMLEVDCNKGMIHAKTTKSNLHLSSSIVHNMDVEFEEMDSGIVGYKELYLSFDSPIQIEKHILHLSDLYETNYLDEMINLKHFLLNSSFNELQKTEKEYYSLFWSNSKISVQSNPLIESMINYNIFQLNNQGGEHEFHNIGAKGLSGEGYEGHYFWDTEIYMLPFFLLTNPKKAKRLIKYRYHTLDKSKEEARKLGYQHGAKIAWRTINGEETSPYYPAGSAQFHINSDIAYSIIKYVELTNDITFFVEYGFEILLETARFLKEAVHYKDGKYHLNCVTGPDEYTTVVDDNYYTNQMLFYHFHMLGILYEENKSALEKTISLLHVTDDEMEEIKHIKDHIYLPFSKEHNIYMQDDNFLNKKRLDISSLPKEKFPLLLHYHPLFLYKHQVLKQADTMLALLLLDYDQLDVLESSYDYYEPITTHDSSLSQCIYSILAYRLNRYEQANRQLLNVLKTDLDDIQGNTSHGLHVANLGGSYLVFMYGIVGLRIHREYVTLRPLKTEEFSHYQFQFMYKGTTVFVEVNESLTVQTTQPLQFKIYDEMITVDGITTFRIQ